MTKNLYSEAPLFGQLEHASKQKVDFQNVRTSQRIQDPFERYNRAMFAFNQKFDAFIYNPFISTLTVLTPPPITDGIHNAFSNLNEVASFFNFLFQGKSKPAGNALARFLINSTLGLLGFVDVASMMGIKKKQTGFNFTLRSWGAKPGAYFVWPILGPSTMRDGAGLIVDFFLDPLNIYGLAVEKVKYVDEKVIVSLIQDKQQYWRELWSLKQQALDPYSVERSIYYQKRDLLYELEDEGPEPLE